MAFPTRTRSVDTGNPSLMVECPSCHLEAARFSPYCRNCGYSFWPNRALASRAFRTWKAADPAGRAEARPYDSGPLEPTGPELVDYEAKAKGLGIHLFPGTRYPILICLGFLFLAFGAAPLQTVSPNIGPIIRWVGAIVGFVFFFSGVGGWWLVEDIKMYEENVKGGHGGEH